MTDDSLLFLWNLATILGLEWTPIFMGIVSYRKV